MINEHDYKPDFEILNRYLDFSSELLRLSLLAMGSFGSLILLVIKEDNHKIVNVQLENFFYPMILFSFAAVGALFHRYCASDSMSWYISQLRAKDKNDVVGEKKEKLGLSKMLKLSSRSLIFTCGSFSFGLVTFAFAIYKLIF